MTLANSPRLVRLFPARFIARATGANVRVEMSFVHDGVRFDPFLPVLSNALPIDFPFVVPPAAFFPLMDYRFEVFEPGGSKLTVLKRAYPTAAFT